jgi:hypothetical protein
MINKFTATAAIAGLFAHGNAITLRDEGTNIPGTDGTDYPEKEISDLAWGIGKHFAKFDF